MQHLSAENGRVAAWCAKHPVFLAFGLCAFGLAVAAAVWGLGILSSATATVVAVLYGVFLGAFLMEYFRINEIVRTVRSICSALTGIWWLLTFWRA